MSYLRTADIQGNVYSNFMMGKGYIAKEKRAVLQQKLLGAVNVVRLDHSIRETTISIDQSYFWSDSTATLQNTDTFLVHIEQGKTMPKLG